MSQAGMKQTPVAASKTEITAYLVFNGRCEEAFKFYEKSLGGKIQTAMTFGDSPMADQAPADWGKKIMHARMTVGDTVLMARMRRQTAMKNPRAFRFQWARRTRRKRSGFSTSWQQAGKCRCPCSRLSGRRNSGCWSIALAYRG